MPANDAPATATYRVIAKIWLDLHDPAEVQRYVDELADYLAQAPVEFSVITSEPVDPETGEPFPSPHGPRSIRRHDEP